MYKLITSAKHSNDLSIGFDRDRGRRRDELTRNKNIKGKQHLRILFMDMFNFAEHPQKAIYGLGYVLTITRNKDEAVTDKHPGIAEARITIDHIRCYVPHNTPSIQQKGI